MSKRNFILDVDALSIMNVRFAILGDPSEFESLISSELPDIVCFQNVLGNSLEYMKKLDYRWHAFAVSKFTVAGVVGVAIFSRVMPAYAGTKNANAYMHFGRKLQIFSSHYYNATLKDDIEFTRTREIILAGDVADRNLWAVNDKRSLRIFGEEKSDDVQIVRGIISL